VNRREEREARAISYATVWVHADAIVHGRDRRYHWTDQCVRGSEGASLVEITREEAETNPKMRPCKLCASGGKGRDYSRDLPGESAVD
jgi:hypothetical protein